MSILNRYILGKFMRPFGASFLALCIIMFVSSILERLDRFLSEGVSFAHVIGYLLTSLPFQALQVLPVACLLATLFVVGNLARTREYIAGLASGLPPERFLGGLFVAGFCISLLALVANETIVPPLTGYARTVYNDKIRRLGELRQSVQTNLFVAGADGRLWNIKTLDEDTGKIKRVVVDTYADGRLGTQIDAAEAQWNKQNGWTFSDGILRTFDTDSATLTNQESFKTKIYPLAEKPSDFVLQEPQPEEMTYTTLKRHIKRLSALGVPVRSLEVELMMKIAFPFSCFVVVLLGVPLSLKWRGSRAIGVAAGVALSFAYLGFMQFGKALAQRMIPPFAGAWLGNIVFLAVGLTLWWRMRRTA